MTPLEESRIPVIVGVGQINDRPSEDSAGLDTLQLMKAALEIADRDAGGGWIKRIESLDVVDQMSWPTMTWPSIERIAPALADALEINPDHLGQTPDPSGDGPVRLINEAAIKIQSGKAEIAAIVGGEALRSGARRAALIKQETGRPADQSQTPELLRDVSERNFRPLLRRYGLLTPIDIYPLFENACRAAWGQTLAQAQEETARIWSDMSYVAAENSDAWIRRRYSPAEIMATSADNRMVGFPYNKLMIANNSVNQGAAVIVTSARTAREAGIPESRLVYIGRGAAAHEPEDFLGRARYDYSPGMEVSLIRAMELNGLAAADLDFVEFYSCFPCIPKMARRIIGLPLEKPHSVYGGLTFGGAPIGNCMTHAAATMVNRLRERGTHGLLYGNGGFATHNHSLVLTRSRSASTPASFDFQNDADAKRDPVPRLVEHYRGPAQLESFSVPFDRAGQPRFGIVIARNPAGDRLVCHVPEADGDGLDFLMSGKTEPVGSYGRAIAGADGITLWQR